MARKGYSHCMYVVVAGSTVVSRHAKKRAAARKANAFNLDSSRKSTARIQVHCKPVGKNTLVRVAGTKKKNGALRGKNGKKNGALRGYGSGKGRIARPTGTRGTKKRGRGTSQE